mmetsp:Transcript_40936/g.75732  ORF Transcript_40936/g.75732 Transcript_40936/m.75732 type:complete len:80 (-) Transcript_40936:56-295(-)
MQQVFRPRPKKFHPAHKGVYFIATEGLDADTTAELTVVRGRLGRKAAALVPFAKMTSVEVSETVYMAQEKKARGQLTTG